MHRKLDPWRRDDRGSMLNRRARASSRCCPSSALTFVSVMRLEATASTNYVDGVRPGSIAEGGLEMASACMKYRAMGRATPTPRPTGSTRTGNYHVRSRRLARPPRRLG